MHITLAIIHQHTCNNKIIQRVYEYICNAFWQKFNIVRLHYAVWVKSQHEVHTNRTMHADMYAYTQNKTSSSLFTGNGIPLDSNWPHVLALQVRILLASYTLTVQRIEHSTILCHLRLCHWLSGVESSIRLPNHCWLFKQYKTTREITNKHSTRYFMSSTKLRNQQGIPHYKVC